MHLIKDNFSISDVAWLQPFTNKKFEFGLGVVKYKIGNLMEMIILLGFLLLLITEIKILDVSATTTFDINFLKLLGNIM